MKVAGWIVFFIFWVVICYLVLSLWGTERALDLSIEQNGEDSKLSIYLIFIGVMLTAVTVVLAAVAIGIGIVAAYTFGEIKNEARKIAEETARKKADDALSEQVIRRRIDEIAFRNTQQRRDDELEFGFDPNDQGER